MLNLLCNYYTDYTNVEFIIIDVDECILGLSRCENGATCINTIGGYECICAPGYTGPLCAAGTYTRVLYNYLLVINIVVLIHSEIFCTYDFGWVLHHTNTSKVTWKFFSGFTGEGRSRVPLHALFQS